MAMVGVMVANFYVGLNATAWTLWLTAAVLIGTIVLWVFTVSSPRPFTPSVCTDKAPIDSGYLFGSQPQLCFDCTLRQQLLPLHLSILLAMHTDRLSRATAPSVPRKVLQLLDRTHRPQHPPRRKSQESASGLDAVLGTRSYPRPSARSCCIEAGGDAYVAVSWPVSYEFLLSRTGTVTAFDGFESSESN